MSVLFLVLSEVFNNHLNERDQLYTDLEGSSSVQ